MSEEIRLNDWVQTTTGDTGVVKGATADLLDIMCIDGKWAHCDIKRASLLRKHGEIRMSDYTFSGSPETVSYLQRATWDAANPYNLITVIPYEAMIVLLRVAGKNYCGVKGM